jgi:predicted amidohydrolase YtcJ
MIQILKDWATPENVKLTGWIFGMGFDDSILEDQRFPTKDDLDKVSTEIPVMVIHISGHFEEDSKGTLEVGKLADMVILNANPLQVELNDIKDITVLTTIKSGEVVYEKN